MHLSRELHACPCHGRTGALLVLLAGGSGPIPAPSAIAGVVTRVDNLERSVEFHEQAILELERQAAEVEKMETKVVEMAQQMMQLERLSGEVDRLSAAEARSGAELRDFEPGVRAHGGKSQGAGGPWHGDDGRPRTAC